MFPERQPARQRSIAITAAVSPARHGSQAQALQASGAQSADSASACCAGCHNSRPSPVPEAVALASASCSQSAVHSVSGGARAHSMACLLLLVLHAACRLSQFSAIVIFREDGSRPTLLAPRVVGSEQALGDADARSLACLLLLRHIQVLQRKGLPVDAGECWKGDCGSSSLVSHNAAVTIKRCP